MEFTAEAESSCMFDSELEAVVSEEDELNYHKPLNTSLFNTYYREGGFDLSPG